jgi:hypothetical protein
MTYPRTDLEAVYRRRDAAAKRQRAILARAQAEGRVALSRDEAIAISDARAERAAANAELDAYDGRSRQSFPAARAVADSRALPAYDQVARIGQEARTYRPDHDPNGKGFLLDVLRSQLRGAPDAWGRLERHMNEERVEGRFGQQERAAGDATTGAFAGLTVPQYLVDLYAPAATARRPFADYGCSQHPLPDQGMALDISRITTGTSTALQANELDTVSATSIDDTLLTIPVLTAAGQQKVSRQAIDRGAGIGDLVLADLMAHCAQTLDSTLITQGTTGLSAVAQNVAYTDASPTGPELYPKLMNAQSNVEIALLGPPVTHATMHSRRWAWLSKEMSSTWPMINSQGIPTQASGTSDNAPYSSGVRGTLPNGLRVIVDNNIATNLGAGTEDEIYVTAASECHLWEAPNSPLYIRAEQPASPNLGVLLVVWEYFAYTFSRYTNGAGKISGTGLIAPTF